MKKDTLAHFPKAAFDVAAMAAPAGGLTALSQILTALPADFPAAIAVVLTGAGSDRAMEIQAIKKMGGTVVTQDEKTSEFYAMPSAAIHTGKLDFILPWMKSPRR